MSSTLLNWASHGCAPTASSQDAAILSVPLSWKNWIAMLLQVAST